MTRIVFMGTPDFAVPALTTLIETQQVVGVVTQPDRPAGRGQQLQPSPVKVVAQAAGLPVYQPLSLKDPEAAAPLREWQPEAIVVAAYGQILRPYVLDLPSWGCLNVHASLLPRWRGASPIQRAILAGDATSGVSLMQMDPGMDTGPVFVQQAIPIRAEETAQTLHDRLAELGGAMLRDYLDEILAGRIAATPQNDAEATYAPMLDKKEGRLDWTQSAAQIDRHVRAMSPWPSAFTFWEGKRLKLLSARPLAGGEVPDAAPGTVVGDESLVAVRTGEGALQLSEVQLAGKSAMPVGDFVRGRPDFLGSRLE